MLSATAGVGRGTVPLFLSRVVPASGTEMGSNCNKWTALPLTNVCATVKDTRLRWSCDLTQYPDTTLRWDVTVSTAPISSQSLLAVQLAKICKCVFIKHRTWTLYVSWHQDTSCGCFSPCEADPRSHLQFCYVPLMLDWIGIWGVSRPGMTIWAILSCSSNGICDLAG